MEEKDIKCPVCGKTDIPDYHAEDVTCPYCGSDLSIYRVVDQIPEGQSSRNIWKPISAVAILAAAVLGGLLVTHNIGPKKSTTSATLLQLEDSITRLNKQMKQETSKKMVAMQGFQYIVRRGDSYWSVSKKFHGTGTRATEIAQSNGRTLDTELNPGDTLIIK